MRTKRLSIGLVIVATECVLLYSTGYGKEPVPIMNQVDPILSSMEQIPAMIHLRRWRAVDRFVYSNICCSIRAVSDKERRAFYTRAYTNLVSRSSPRSVAGSNMSASDLEDWRIVMENYCDLVRWGAVLINENLDVNPDTVEFPLRPIFLIRQEIDAHKRRLAAQNVDSRLYEKNYHVRMLDDLLYRCTYEINRIWYPEAKRKLAPEQLRQVRQKVRDVLDKLPPEMAKDDESDALPRVLMKQ